MENSTVGIPPNTFGNSSPDDSVLTKTTSDAHAVVSSITDAAVGAARKTKPAIEQVAAAAHQMVDKVAASGAPAVDWIGEQSESLNATQKKLLTDTSTYIAANPLTSVTMAVLAGFLVSRLIRI